MFDLTTPTKAKVLDVIVLSQKNRQPDENPGGKIVLEFDISPDKLAAFDGSLFSFLYTRDAAKQGSLDGMEGYTLTKAAARLGTLRWRDTFSGMQWIVDQGIGGKSNLVLSDCTLSTWRLTPKDGGSTKVKVNIETADVATPIFGRLAKLKSCEITTQLLPPEKAPDLVDSAETPAPPAKAKKGKGPTEEFIEKHASASGEADVSGSKKVWPFPKDLPPGPGEKFEVQ